MDVGKEGMETLRKAAFPVYAVPPSEWPGDVIVGGFSGEPNHPLTIRLRYDDDVRVEWPRRRIEIASTGAEGLGRRAPRESYLMWEHSYRSDIWNFVSNIAPERFLERPTAGSERYNEDVVDGDSVPRTLHPESAGPRRLIDPVPFNGGLQIERVAFERRAKLRMYRIQLRRVELLMLAWGWADGPLERFMSLASSLREDRELFAEVERAEYEAWKKIRQDRPR